MNNDIYLRNLCSDCVRSANNLTIAIQRAWDNTVDEFERDMSNFIEQNPLKYNLLERAQFVFQVKGNAIEQQIISRSKAVDELLDGKLNAFEQQVIMLIQDEKQAWLSQNVHRDGILRTREPQLYQEIVAYLTENLQKQNVACDSTLADLLCELIVTYVFGEECPVCAESIRKILYRTQRDSFLFLLSIGFIDDFDPHALEEPGFCSVAIDRMRKTPKAIWTSTYNKVIHRLNTRCQGFVVGDCEPYVLRAQEIQEWIGKKLNETLDAVE